MIKVTKLDNEQVLINPDNILVVESVGDTSITFLNRQQLRVKETPKEISIRFVAYKKNISSVLEQKD